MRDGLHAITIERGEQSHIFILKLMQPGFIAFAKGHIDEHVAVDVPILFFQDCPQRAELQAGQALEFMDG